MDDVAALAGFPVEDGPDSVGEEPDDEELEVEER